MAISDHLSFPAQQVRRLDRDRFLTALFAPPNRREALLILYAFNLELAQVREKVSQPILGQMRLQWWRDRVAAIFEGGPIGAHPVALPLADAVERFGLSRHLLDALIEARERDMSEDPPATMEELERYAEHTASTLNTLALEILTSRGDAAEEAGRRVGIAWALIGLLRAVPFHAAAGRLYLPSESLARHGVAVADILAGRPSPGLTAVARDIAERAATHLEAARQGRRDVPKAALPALLTAPLADGYLRDLRTCRFDPFSPRMFVARPSLVRLSLAGVTRRY